MKLTYQNNDYDFYKGYDKPRKQYYYNIVPTGSICINSGYFNINYIIRVKRVNESKFTMFGNYIK